MGGRANVLLCGICANDTTTRYLLAAPPVVESRAINRKRIRRAINHHSKSPQDEREAQRKSKVARLA